MSAANELQNKEIYPNQIVYQDAYTHGIGVAL